MNISKPEQNPEAVLLTETELTTSVALALGMMVIAFSRFELNIDLTLNLYRNVGSPSKKHLLLGAKIDKLKQLYYSDHIAFPEKTESFKKWCKEVELACFTRNRFTHGRLGINQYDQSICSVALFSNQENPPVEIKYSLESLQDELEDIRKLLSRLSDFKAKWGLPI